MGIGLAEGQHAVLGRQLVGNRLAGGVPPAGIGDLPVAGGVPVSHPLRLRLAEQRGLPHHPGVAVRVLRAGRQRHRVTLIDGVLRAVDHHVQPYAEDVLVVGAVDLGGDQGAVRRLLSRGQGPVGDHAGQLDLVFDGAVLVEVPEVAVLVVSDGGDHRDHQPPRAPDLGLAGPPVHVLPAHAVVFLVQADHVLDHLGVAVVVVQPGVEVVDLAQAVAAQFQAVGQDPDAVLPHVEDVLAVVRRVRVAVRDEHLRERGAVDHRPECSVVLVANQEEDQPFARGEADPEPPFLPVHLVPVHGEAGAVRLGDLDGLQVLPGAVREMRNVRGVAYSFGGVVAAARRQRHHSVVLDVHDFHAVEVEADDQALHRAGVSVVVRITPAHPGQRPEEAAPGGRVLGAVVADRPGVDHDHVEVGDAPPAHRLLPAGILPDGLLGGQELLQHDRWLDTGHLAPQPNLPGGQGDDGLVRSVFGPLPEHDVRLALERLARLVAQDVILGRLPQRDVDETGARGQAAVAPEDPADGLDLLRRQRLQRMPYPCPDVLSRRHPLVVSQTYWYVKAAAGHVSRSAREVLRALGGQFAVQQASGLADLDEVSVRVSYVAADLRPAVDRRRDELRSLRFPLLVAGLDVGDPQVQEDRGGVAGLVVDHRDAWLVGGGRPARIHDDPGIGQPDRTRVLLQDDGAAQDAGVEVPRSRDLADGDEHRHQDALSGRGEAGEIVAGRGFGHDLLHFGYWSPARTDVMRWVLKPSQCIRPT